LVNRVNPGPVGFIGGKFQETTKFPAFGKKKVGPKAFFYHSSGINSSFIPGPIGGFIPILGPIFPYLLAPGKD